MPTESNIEGELSYGKQDVSDVARAKAEAVSAANAICGPSAQAIVEDILDFIAANPGEYVIGMVDDPRNIGDYADLQTGTYRWYATDSARIAEEVVRSFMPSGPGLELYLDGNPNHDIVFIARKQPRRDGI
jgi:hypothetical protein